MSKKEKKEKEINFNITEYMAFKFMYIGKNYDGLVIQSTTQNTIEEILFNSLKKCKFLNPTKNKAAVFVYKDKKVNIKENINQNDHPDVDEIGEAKNPIKESTDAFRKIKNSKK